MSVPDAAVQSRRASEDAMYMYVITKGRWLRLLSPARCTCNVKAVPCD